MRGQDGIIKMRKQGFAPAMISLDDFNFPSPLTNWETHGDTPTVCVHNDVIEGLDLRFLVNMMVSITSNSEERAKHLFTACIDAGAKWVGASHTVLVGEVARTGWLEIYHG